MMAQTEVGGMVVTEKVRKTREGKPKSRNGCKTCKLRRVKCDETKPHCMRCTRFGQRCDGYLARAPTKQSLHITTTRALAPRGPDCSSPITDPHSARSSGSPNAQTSASPPVNRSNFFTQSEFESYNRFCERSSKRLRKIPHDKWSHFVLQACESSPSIRYAVTSIGALGQTANSPANGVGTLQHQSAFSQYKQAECVLRRGFGGELYDFKSTMTGCLLFFCFDGFRPCRELPVERVILGLRQLRDWTSRVHGVGDRKEPLAPAEALESDEEIMAAFKSMETMLIMHVDERERLVQQDYLRMGRVGSEPMPSLFETVEIAKTSLESIIRRSMQSLRSSMRTQDFSPSDVKLDMAFYATDPRFDEKDMILREYRRWDTAFQPLLNFARSKGSSEDNFLRASLLRLHWLSGYLSLSSGSSTSSLMNNRQYKIELDELISIAELMLRKTKTREQMLEGSPQGERGDLGFAFDMQVIVPVMTVAWICRHRALRREAIELLSQSSKRDSEWDGVVIGKAMAWLASMEEAGLNEQEQNEVYIPERAVVRGIKMSFDTDKRMAFVSCLQPSTEALGAEKESRIEIPW